MTDQPSTSDNSQLRRLLNLPPDVPRARYRPPGKIEVPEGAAPEELFVGKPDDPDSRKVQEVWVARVRVFRLPQETEEYQAVWQRVTDGEAFISRDNNTHGNLVNWDPTKSEYVALLRWVELEYKLPSEVGGVNTKGDTHVVGETAGETGDNAG